MTRTARLAIVLALAIATALPAGCSRGTDALSDPAASVAEQTEVLARLDRPRERGRRLFAEYCATCHGEAGDGRGQNASLIDPPPANLRADLDRPSHAHTRRVIEDGSAAVGRSPLCPPRRRQLTARDIESLVVYVTQLAEDRGPTDPH